RREAHGGAARARTRADPGAGAHSRVRTRAVVDALRALGRRGTAFVLHHVRPRARNRALHEQPAVRRVPRERRRSLLARYSHSSVRRAADGRARARWGVCARTPARAPARARRFRARVVPFALNRGWSSSVSRRALISA